MSTIKNLRQEIADHSTYLRPFAMKLTKNSDDCDDLIQDTVVRALMNADKFVQGTNLKGWMYTIMKNIFINNYRKASKRNTIIDTTDNQYYINSSDRSVMNDAEQNFLHDNIQQAMSEVQDDYRIPFKMYYEGYKYNEIAEILEIPLGTVKSRIYFSRKEMQSNLAKLGIMSSAA